MAIEERMPDVWIKGLGEKRGAPYLYLDGLQAIRAGLKPGQKYNLVVDPSGKALVLTAHKDGTRTVSVKRKGEKEYPVIDINSRELLAIFDGMSSVRVAVKDGKVFFLPLASEIKKRERISRVTEKMLNGEKMTMGSLSHGGGILSHAIHSGLEKAGMVADMKFVNEIREDLIDQAIEQNDAWSPGTAALVMPMQEAAQDEWVLGKLPKIEILEMGLPCSGASKAGASKRGLTKMEDHPEVGHLVFAALVILNKTQPAVVLLENVPEYADSASAMILRHQLRDMGYDTHEAILSGKDFGCLENRVRWCMVAVTSGMDFSFENLKPTVTVVKTVGDILDKSITADDPRYRAVEYLKDKEKRDKEAGKGFSMQTITADSTSVPTLRKGYHKGGSTDPRLLNPDDPKLSRLLTAEEHARVKGVPPRLIDGLSNTIAHELLGQGIVYAPFESVGKAIGDALNKLVIERGIKVSVKRARTTGIGFG